MVISQSVLGNMTWNFFWNLQTSYISKREKKIGGPWPLNVVFRSMNSKTRFFWSDFWFLGPNFPMKSFKEGHNFLHDGSCIYLELSFQIWRHSNHFSYFCILRLRCRFSTWSRFTVVNRESWSLLRCSLAFVINRCIWFGVMNVCVVKGSISSLSVPVHLWRFLAFRDLVEKVQKTKRPKN